MLRLLWVVFWVALGSWLAWKFNALALTMFFAPIAGYPAVVPYGEFWGDYKGGSDD